MGNACCANASSVDAAPVGSEVNPVNDESYAKSNNVEKDGLLSAAPTLAEQRQAQSANDNEPKKAEDVQEANKENLRQAASTNEADQEYGNSGNSSSNSMGLTCHMSLEKSTKESVMAAALGGSMEKPAIEELEQPAEEPAQMQIVEKGPMTKAWEDMLRNPPMTEKETEFLRSVGRPRPSIANTEWEDYAKKHAQMFDKLREMESMDGWTLKKTVDGTSIYTKSVPGEDLLRTKGVCTMTSHGNGIRHLLAWMLYPEDRPKYDELCKMGRSIENFLPHYRIIHFQLISPAAIIAPRDILLISRVLHEPDGSLLLAIHHTEHPDVPEDKSYVRCLVQGGYIIRPTGNPDEYTITFAVQSDPRGWLPGWVKALVAWKVPLVLAMFQKFYDQKFGPKK